MGAGPRPRAGRESIYRNREQDPGVLVVPAHWVCGGTLALAPAEPGTGHAVLSLGLGAGAVCACLCEWWWGSKMHKVFHCTCKEALKGAEENGEEGGSTVCARAHRRKFCCVGSSVVIS